MTRSVDPSPLSRLAALASGIAASLLFAAAPAVGAETTLFAKESTPMFAAKKGKILGQIPPGTPVTVLETKGSRALVRIRGWTEEYRDLEVFAEKGVPLARAELVKIDDEHVKVLKEETARFGVEWKNLEVTGWVDRRNLVKDLDKVWKPAREIHGTRCTECHDFMPTSELTAQDWSGILKIMTHRAALTPEESVLLKQYLQTNARDERPE